jgi:hypothetical protein
MKTEQAATQQFMHRFVIQRKTVANIPSYSKTQTNLRTSVWNKSLEKLLRTVKITEHVAGSFNVELTRS